MEMNQNLHNAIEWKMIIKRLPDSTNVSIGRMRFAFVSGHGSTFGRCTGAVTSGDGSSCVCPFSDTHENRLT